MTSNKTNVKELLRQKYSFPGLYPMFGLKTDGYILCCQCASTQIDEINSVEINWDTPLCCSDCDKEIESAYEI